MNALHARMHAIRANVVAPATLNRSDRARVPHRRTSRPDAVHLRFTGAAQKHGAGIVATLGPRSAPLDNPEKAKQTIEAMILAGVHVFRLNFSHGEQTEHAQRLSWVRQAARELSRTGKLRRPVQVMADIQGPKIRVGQFVEPIEGVEQGISLVPGDTVYLTPEEESGDPTVIPVTFPQMITDLNPGEQILLADGTMELRVKKRAPSPKGLLECKVIRGGQLTNSRGINLPHVTLNTPSLSEKDRSDIEFAVGQGVDMLAISFVRNATDMLEARKFVRDLPLAQAKRVKLYSKIEKPEATELTTLRRILRLSDGVMVARGDLGIEAGKVELPALQSRIIREAKRRDLPVIVATQMLESMMDNQMPSNADVSDIASAIEDGVQYVMLSGETAMGNYPVESVEMMNAIVRRYEHRGTLRFKLREVWDHMLTALHRMAAKFGRRWGSDGG